MCFTKEALARPVFLDWIRVTYVCTHWRSVALECAPLWTSICTNPISASNSHIHASRDLVETFLQRSLTDGLNLQISVSERSADWSWQEGAIGPLMLFMSRCKDLYFSGLAEPFYTSLTNTAMPQLRVLALLPDGPQLSEELVPVTSHTVEYLAFSRYHMFSTQQFGNLKQLRMYEQHFEPEDKMRLLFGALAANPFLEDILFNDSSFSDDSAEPALISGSPILPRLRRLAFHNFRRTEHSKFTSSFLVHILIPQRLALTVTRDSWDGACLADMFVPPMLSSSLVTDITTVFIRFHNFSHYDIICAGPSTAWHLETCDIHSDTLMDFAGVLHSAKQLRVSIAWDFEVPDETGTNLIRQWLASHSFEELVLTLGPGRSSGVKWFLDGLSLAYAASQSISTIHTVRVRGADVSSWNPLVNFVTHASSVQNLHFYMIPGLDRPLENDAELQAFENWKDRARRELNTALCVEFHEVTEYARMQLPPICTHEDHGPWEWLDWTKVDKFPVGIT